MKDNLLYVKNNLRLVMKLFKKDGKVDTKYTEVTLDDAIKEIEIFPTMNEFSSGFIKFINDKNEWVHFIRYREDDWRIEIPIIKNGMHVDRLLGKGITTEKVKRFVEKFFRGDDWKSLDSLGATSTVRCIGDRADWLQRKKEKEEYTIKILKTELYASGPDYSIYLHPWIQSGSCLSLGLSRLSQETNYDLFFVQKKTRGCTIRMRTKHRRASDVVQKLEKEDAKKIKSSVSQHHPGFARYTTKNKDITPLLKKVVSSFGVGEYMGEEELVRIRKADNLIRTAEYNPSPTPIRTVGLGGGDTAGEGMAYCVRCRKIVRINNPQRLTMKNGNIAIKGVCDCGTKVFRLGNN